MDKKIVPEMPNKIYACWGGGGLLNDPGYWFKKKLDEDPYDISYTRTDLAQSLADALENARGVIECGYFNTQGKASKSYYKAMKEIDAALKRYRGE